MTISVNWRTGTATSSTSHSTAVSGTRWVADREACVVDKGIHADHLPVFPSKELHDHPHGATMAVVNVPLCEFTAENGAT